MDMREYQKEYRRVHKKHLARLKKAWYSKNREAISNYNRQYNRQYYANNKERISSERRSRRKKRPYKQFGDWVKSRMQALQKEYESLYDHLGINRGSGYKYISGIHLPSTTERKQLLANFLEVKYETLDRRIRQLEKLIQDSV